MRAVLIDAFGQPLRVATVPDPVCPPGGAVIAVSATGLCRSDWYGWMGHDPDIRLPHVPGHELAGVLAAVGSEVRGWQIGDRVTVPFVCACGTCDTCRRGDHQVCDRHFQPGFSGWGSYAELVAIDHAGINLVRLPDGIDDETAAGLGCRFSTSYRAVVQQGRIREGEWVAVHGCGGVGLSAVMIAASRGARVVAVDVSAGALDLARRVGAEVTVDAVRNEVVPTILELTGGGASVSIDALGSRITFRNSIACLRKRGRHVQVGLMVGPDALPAIDAAAVIAGELEIVGSHGMAAREYAAMLGEILAGRLRPRDLVCRRIGLDAAPEALASMGSNPQPGMTLIDPRQA